MGNTSLFRTLLNIIIILLLPASLWAITPMHDKVAIRDSLSRRQQEKEKKKTEDKGGPEQNIPDIREIPKAKKQSRPVIVKPNIKGKPIKVIRPKIKRP
ncbi:hypothetical protein SAMN05421820_106391 [Pedobacter steynii]|uniref:Uncharacterized protein n=1 Tax=Pedobacter steynii TaxID=430522 RepID=A0A1G9Z8P2_9SPHI|nr:hypothetical protein [Pedobacter steynii]NQX39988.1 hypothetical protein [Pedobacter steynii]SDN17792.1 hypothetical protein SAMN05421820_106391 [Pedobacter steynii]